MPKIVIAGDQHFSKNDPFNLHQLKLKFFREFVETWRNQADWVILNGDLEDSSAFNIDLQSELALILSNYKVNRLIVVAGNHEIKRRRSVPMLPFIVGTNANAKGVTFVNETPSLFDSHDNERTDFAVQGWNEKSISVFHSCRFYISHRFVYYDMMPITIIDKHPEALIAARLNHLPYERMIFNDVHKRIDEGKVHSCGVGFASDFKDVDQVSGYGILEYDDKASKFYREDFIGYPIFKKFVLSPDSDYPKEQDVRGNVVRVELSGQHSWNTYKLRKEVESYLRSMEPCYLDVRQVDTQSEKVQVAVAAELKTTEEALQEFMAERNWTERMKAIYGTAKS